VNILLIAAAFAVGSPPDESDWPQWRGPRLNGTSAATKLPVAWSETKNVKWKVKLPSWSGATPVTWGDRIFVASASPPGVGPNAPNVKSMGGRRKPDGQDLLLLCLSRKDGSEIWRVKLAGGNYHIGKQNMSSPSPITDGKNVWAMTGTGVLAALTLEGKPVWQADLQKSYGKFGLNWGYGASPLLWDGMLIVPVLHGMETDDPSYLVAFDAASGKVLWRVERPTDAVNEGPDAYTTPIPMKVGDRTEIIIAGGDYITGHDPKTGRELWRCGGLNPTRDGFYRAVASPLIVDEMIFACIKTGPMVACRGGGTGLVTATHTAWTQRLPYDVPTPVSDGKLLYVLKDDGLMSCYEPKSGRVVYEKQRLPQGTYDASPLLADGKIYVINERARTTVVAAGPEFKVLAENPLDDDYTLASIAVTGNALLIRTSANLYLIGE
jgi:outer membrane protein assembly factor BamB